MLVMFIGHYSVALALKKGEPTASLGFLFLAVQLADILFFPLVLLGIERASIIPDLTEASDLRLDFAPFTHSLLGALVAGAIAFLVFRKIPFGKGANSNKLGLVMGLAVFSHWALDVIAHTPDMALLDGGLPKIGFGLWHSALATFVVEALMVLAGLWLYLRVTEGTTMLARYGMMVFVAFMLLLNVFNLFLPPSDSNRNLTMLAVLALAVYLLLAAIAFWLDSQRNIRPSMYLRSKRPVS
jgi:hypothetical protein